MFRPSSFSFSVSPRHFSAAAATRDSEAGRKKCQLHRTLVRLQRRRATAVDKISRWGNPPALVRAAHARGRQARNPRGGCRVINKKRRRSRSSEMKARGFVASSRSAFSRGGRYRRAQTPISGSNLSTGLRSRRLCRASPQPPSSLLYSRASGMRDYSCAAVGRGPSSADIITRNQRGSFIRLSTRVVERDEGRASPPRKKPRARVRARDHRWTRDAVSSRRSSVWFHHDPPSSGSNNVERVDRGESRAAGFAGGLAGKIDRNFVAGQRRSTRGSSGLFGRDGSC